MTWIEAVAVVFGLICVWLTVRQNIWCWPTGLVQVTLYLAVFYQVKLYSDLILHAIYVVLQLYGWHRWLRGGQRQGPLIVSQLPRGGLLAWCLVTTAGSLIWGWGMAAWTDAAVPYWDALVAVASPVAQWLMTRKRVESWLFWIVVDVVAIGVYAAKALWLTTFLYAVFLVLATIGLLAWRKALDAVTHENRTDPGKVCPAAPGTSTAD